MDFISRPAPNFETKNLQHGCSELGRGRVDKKRVQTWGKVGGGGEVFEIGRAKISSDPPKKWLGIQRRDGGGGGAENNTEFEFRIWVRAVIVKGQNLQAGPSKNLMGGGGGGKPIQNLAEGGEGLK